MDPSKWGESWLARKMAVGPSAPPMMPMEAASKRSKSMPGTYLESSSAPMRVVKMPNWAAAPSSAVLGLASIGPKSVMAPMPMKMIRGKAPDLMPTW